MTIPKEIREKIEQKLKLDKEIEDWIEENLDAEDMVFESIQTLSPGVLFQNRTDRKGVYTNVLVDVHRSGCYSWRKLHESGRLVLVYSWMLCVAYNLESNKGEITMTNREVYERDCEELEQYREIGTVEECRKAVEKQKPKKPHRNYKKFSGLWCKCGWYLGQKQCLDIKYCPNCGQAIDENLEGMDDERNNM